MYTIKLSISLCVSPLYIHGNDTRLPKQSLHLYVNNYKVVSAFLKSQVAYINSYIVVVQLLWYIMVYGLLSEHWSDYFSPSHRIYLLPYSQLLNMYSIVVMRLVRGQQLIIMEPCVCDVFDTILLTSFQPILPN